MDFDNCYTDEELEEFDKRDDHLFKFKLGDIVIYMKKKYFIFSRNVSCFPNSECWYTLQPFKWNGDYDRLTWAYESQLQSSVSYVQLSLFEV